MPPSSNNSDSKTIPAAASSSSSLQNWLTDFQSDPNKIILLSSLILHVLLIICILLLCFKYRSLSSRFKKLKIHLKQELDDRKKETTKLHNFFNNTRPNTQSTSGGAYFDDCYADQKLLPQKNNNKSSTSSVLEGSSPKIEAASTPPTPLPRSKSKPEFQLNISNNNNVTEEEVIIAKPKILKELNNNAEVINNNNDSWFIPVTPATKRCKSTVQHTPVTERTHENKQRHNSGPSEMNKQLFNNNNTPPKVSGDNELNTSNPLAGMSLWEQHESRPVLKHQT